MFIAPIQVQMQIAEVGLLAAVIGKVQSVFILG